MFQKLIEKLFGHTLIYYIHLYPFSLESMKHNKLNKYLYTLPKGKCLEVGCWDLERKTVITKVNRKVESYLATDYDVTNSQNIEVVDEVCNALDLPFPDNSFDCHLSFEVLEHMPDPYLFFSEANRILKRGGLMIFTVPFFYRLHGTVERMDDYFRFSDSAFYEIAKKTGFYVKEVLSNTGFGTSIAVMINTFIIRKIFECNLMVRIVLSILSPLIFFITNVIGYLIDLSPDGRYPTRYHVVFKKK